ncbi:MAG: UxaA family hydrolase [Alphaproteobacteria bacterium]|nr:UxaA family hydrolase [Alphaproteobacteria bacterium]
MRWDALALDVGDDVAVALHDIVAGETVRVRRGEALQEVVARAPIALGHKLALRAIAAGEAVRKYGQPIGAATAPVGIGEHVHVHNLASLRGRARR